jgi:hypothetical protein
MDPVTHAARRTTGRAREKCSEFHHRQRLVRGTHWVCRSSFPARPRTTRSCWTGPLPVKSGSIQFFPRNERAVRGPFCISFYCLLPWFICHNNRSIITKAILIILQCRFNFCKRWKHEIQVRRAVDSDEILVAGRQEILSFSIMRNNHPTSWRRGQ